MKTSQEYINEIVESIKKTIVVDKQGNNFELDVGLDEVAKEISSLKCSVNKIIFIGNGGSAAIANHKALDFWYTGNIKAISFCSDANLTCVTNDLGYENVFAKQIKVFAQKGDILVAISSSGNSVNILNGVKQARKLGCKVFTFSGFKEKNKLIGLGDLNFYLPLSHFNQVETSHLLLCDCILEKTLNL